MVWVRRATIWAKWRCETTRGYYTRDHFVVVKITDTYAGAKKPIEDMDDWIRRVGKEVATKMCEHSCETLADKHSVYCDYSSVGYDLISMEETREKIRKKMLVRTLSFRAQFRCSKMAEKRLFIYRNYEVSEELEQFPQSLIMWRDQKLGEVIEEFRRKCESIGMGLFGYDTTDIRVSEDIKYIEE